jgi:ABC-type bacteriocin/lantibiotic exporter with double-glycine peptidase domain
LSRSKNRFPESSGIDRNRVESVFSWNRHIKQSLDVPTTSTCAAIALAYEHFGVPVAPLVSIAETSDLMEAIAILGTQHLVAGREVELREGWWGACGEVLTVKHCDFGSCTLVPRKGSYVALEPGEDHCREHSVDQEFARGCASTAVEFMRVPPPGKNNLSELLRASMTGLYPELTRRLAAAGAAALLGIVPPIMVAVLIDDVIPNGQTRGLVGISIALLVTTAATSLLLLISSLAALRLDNGLAFRLEAIILTRELEGRHRSTGLPPGELLQRIAAINWAMGFITRATQTVFVQSLRGVANLGLLFAYSTVFGAVGLVTVVGCLLLILVDGVLQYSYIQASLQVTGTAQEKLVQLLRGLESARDRSIKQRLFLRWMGDRTGTVSLDYRAAATTNYRLGLQKAIVGVALFALYYSTAYGSAGDVTTGEIVASFSAFAILATALVAAGEVLNTIANVLPIFERLNPLIENEEAFPGKDRPPLLSGAFYAENIQGAPGAGHQIRRATFEIQARSVNVIAAEEPAIGPHILRTLLALTTSDGTVEVDGYRVGSFDPGLLREQGGTLIGTPRLLPASLRENLDFAGQYSDNDLEEALRESGSLQILRDLPDGLDCNLDKKIRDQELATRLAITRLHLGHRQFYSIVDLAELHATPWWQSFLDTVLEKDGSTRIISSIQPRILRCADQVLVFNKHGGLETRGSFAELQSSPDRIPAGLRERFL